MSPSLGLEPLQESEDQQGGWKLVLFEITVYLVLVLGLLASMGSPVTDF